MKEAEKQQSTKTALAREQQGICKGIQQETVVLNKASGGGETARFLPLHQDHTGNRHRLFLMFTGHLIWQIGV